MFSYRTVFELAQGLQHSKFHKTSDLNCAYQMCTCLERSIGVFQKNPNNGWGWVHGIPRGTEETACGNSKGQLKKNWNFQWNF